MAAFAEAGDRDLTAFQDQWLARTGAPELTLGAVEFSAKQVTFELTQSSLPYDLVVPVVLQTAQGSEEHLVTLDSAAERFTVAADAATEIAIDPDYHLFRVLPEEDIEPTISQVLAAKEPVFITGADDPMLQSASREFAVNYAQNEDVSVRADGEILSNGQAHIIINPFPELLKKLSPSDLIVSGRTVFLAGKRYSLDKYDLVFTAYDPDNREVTHLVVVCDSGPRLISLASRVTHYGKYSWLLMPVGTGRPDRGNWSTQESPLTRQK